jgi:uncharacterized protein YbjT (DUF2867 family)
MKKELMLVVGASGTVGSELIAQLKKQGYRTKATTSKKVQNSEDLVHINLATGEGIKEAFEDVDKAFFLSPPGYADQYSMLSPLIKEAKRRGLKKVVLMTAMGANASDSTPFRRAEIELEKSGLNYNIIRPNWFLQNFNTFWVQGINAQNKILVPAGNAKVSFIDARDIASVAAKLLVSDAFDRKDFDLTGSEAVDHAQVAEAISKVSGRKVEYKEISPEDLKQGLQKGGVPEDYANFLVMIFGFLREGYNQKLTTSVKDITGLPPKSLAQYANDYKNSWVK